MAATKTGWGDLAIRVLSASVGAYALCYAWVSALILLLPRVTSLDGVDAAILSTCGAFIVFVAVIVHAFAVRSAGRLILQISAATVLPLIIIGLLQR